MSLSAGKLIGVPLTATSVAVMVTVRQPWIKFLVATVPMMTEPLTVPRVTASPISKEQQRLQQSASQSIVLSGQNGSLQQQSVVVVSVAVQVSVVVVVG